MTKDIISIIVPTYNRASLIKQTIESVIDQTYFFWELVIVDDGSSDDTEGVIEAFNDDRIRFIKRSRLPAGAPTCRNIGLESCTGQYVIFLDSDDLLLPNTLEQRVAAIQINKEVDFLVFQTAFFETSIADSSVLWNRFDESNDLTRFLESDIVWHTSGSIFSRDFLHKGGHKFAEALQSSQDWQFHLMILLSKPRYLKINSLPDVFIRRDRKNTRISDEHGSPVKILNRLGVMKQIMELAAIQENSRHIRSIFKTVFREFSGLLNTKISFDHTLLSSFKNHMQNDKDLLSVYTYLSRGNMLAKIHFYLWRLYDKMAGSSAKVFLRSNGQYRSAMRQDELVALDTLLQQQNVLKNDSNHSLG